MTLVGKIFTMLIFVMSLGFMFMAMMVFATHRNWRQHATNPNPGPGEELGLQQKLDQYVQLKRNADATIQSLKTTLEQERAARKHALAAMTARATKAESELSIKEGELNTANGQVSVASKALETAQNRLAALETEITGIRSDMRTTEQDRDGKFASVVSLTDQLNQAISQRDELDERNKQLTQQAARMKMVMDAKGLTITSLVDYIPPKNVDAVVLEVSEKDLLEISIGSDDGLKVGHTMEVYRDNTYLGRITIIRVAGDRAVGRIEKNLQRGQIKRGDRVSTKFSS